jgi:hypothetical protein
MRKQILAEENDTVPLYLPFAKYQVARCTRTLSIEKVTV